MSCFVRTCDITAVVSLLSLVLSFSLCVSRPPLFSVCSCRRYFPGSVEVHAFAVLMNLILFKSVFACDSGRHDRQQSMSVTAV